LNNHKKIIFKNIELSPRGTLYKIKKSFYLPHPHDFLDLGSFSVTFIKMSNDITVANASIQLLVFMLYILHLYFF